jgi:hypothetical protein
LEWNENDYHCERSDTRTRGADTPVLERALQFVVARKPDRRMSR